MSAEKAQKPEGESSQSDIVAAAMRCVAEGKTAQTIDGVSDAVRQQLAEFFLLLSGTNPAEALRAGMVDRATRELEPRSPRGGYRGVRHGPDAWTPEND